MGATSSMRWSGISNWEFYSNEYNGIEFVEMSPIDWKTIAVACVPCNGNEIFGGIISQHISHGTCTYRFDDETCGPYGTAPLKLLMRLSPTTNEYALGWRKTSMRAAQLSYHFPKLQIGDVFQFEDNSIWEVAYAFDIKAYANRLRHEIYTPYILIRNGEKIFDSKEAQHKPIPVHKAKPWEFDVATSNWKEEFKCLQGGFEDLVAYLTEHKYLTGEIFLYGQGGRYLVYRTKRGYSLSDRYGCKPGENNYRHHLLTDEGYSLLRRLWIATAVTAGE